MKTVICTDIHGKKYKVPMDQLKWRPSAYGIVIKDGALLLSKQVGGYDLPGGGVDLGESPEEAVIREIKEETGLTATNSKILEVRVSYFKLPRSYDEFVEAIMFYYKCDYVSGNFSVEGFDEYEKEYAETPEWVPLEALDKTKLDRSKIASSIDWRDIVSKVATEK
jgi:8-oxo-dGTP diphosphatase